MRRLKIYPVKFDGRHFSPESFLGQVNSEKNSRFILEIAEFLMRSPWVCFARELRFVEMVVLGTVNRPVPA